MNINCNFLKQFLILILILKAEIKAEPLILVTRDQQQLIYFTWSQPTFYYLKRDS